MAAKKANPFAKKAGAKDESGKKANPFARKAAPKKGKK
jgi:hypothetical protein